MTTASDLMTGAALRLAAHNAGTWSPNGAYTDGQTGITIKAVPQSPDAIIALTVYDRETSPNPDLTNQLVRLQVRLRSPKGRPDNVDDLADLVDTAFSGHHMTWGTIRIARAHRVSYLPLGPDGNGRHELSCNYAIHLA